MVSALTVNVPHREIGKGVLVNWLFGKKKKEGWFVTFITYSDSGTFPATTVNLPAKIPNV